MAEKIGFSEAAIQKWENGERNLKPATLEKLADFFGVDPTRFLVQPSVYGDLRWVQVVELPHTNGLRAAMSVADPRNAVPFQHPCETLVGIEMKDGAISRVAPVGSVLVFDYTDCAPADGQLYVIQVGERIAARRYRDNPARYEPDTIEAGHDTIFPAKDFLIHGRAIGVYSHLPSFPSNH